MNTPLHVQDLLEKKTRKPWCKKKSGTTGIYPFQFYPRGKLFRTCLACLASFNNFTTTINDLGRMHRLNWLSSTHEELHFIPHQTTSITFLMILNAFWTWRVIELHLWYPMTACAACESNTILCNPWECRKRKKKKRGINQDLPLSKPQTSTNVSRILLLSSSPHMTKEKQYIKFFKIKSKINKKNKN